ncbi:MAG: hypothetical protein HN590_14990 [Calditrichaeota bacterium]|nr:hypothetical protein [Calditrichota bacterium]
MKKIDFKKELKHLYKPTVKKFATVEVPDTNFIMIDGIGNPNTEKTYAEAVQVIFGLSYTIKFMVKKGDLQIDYGVLPLEGLWWMDDMSRFSVDTKDEWKWTMMIMQPEFITRDIYDHAIKELIRKKNPSNIAQVRFEPYSEGLSAQIMYIGPYADEEPAIKKLHEYIHDEGFNRYGKHHEIYLSDPRRSKPEKLKTVLRQPMRK